MSEMASEIISLTIVCSTVCSCADQKTSKLRVTGLCEGNRRSPVDSRHKGPITRKMFLFDDVIMLFLPVTAVEGHVEWTVEDAVEHLGFGWFQIRFVIICGLLTVSHDVMIWSIFFTGFQICFVIICDLLTVSWDVIMWYISNLDCARFVSSSYAASVHIP